MRKFSQGEVDEYGRITLLKEILEKVEIQLNDYIYMEALENGQITIRKWGEQQKSGDKSIRGGRLVAEIDGGYGR